MIGDGEANDPICVPQLEAVCAACGRILCCRGGPFQSLRRRSAGAAFVRPFEEGAFEVYRLSGTGGNQLFRERGRPVADRAIEHERAGEVDLVADLVGGRTGRDADGIGQVADGVFFRLPHIEQQGRIAGGISQPGGQFAGRNLWHRAELGGDLLTAASRITSGSFAWLQLVSKRLERPMSCIAFMVVFWIARIFGASAFPRGS